MRKLIKAQFYFINEVGLQKVLDAFCQAFSSIKGMQAVPILEFLNGESDGEDIANLLDFNSAGGQRPGIVYRRTTAVKRTAEKLSEVLVIPSCGDRKMIVGRNHIAECDYSARPSLVSAAAVVELAAILGRDPYDFDKREDKAVYLFNDLVYSNV